MHIVKWYFQFYKDYLHFLKVKVLISCHTLRFLSRVCFLVHALWVYPLMWLLSVCCLSFYKPFQQYIMLLYRLWGFCDKTLFISAAASRAASTLITVEMRNVYARDKCRYICFNKSPKNYRECLFMKYFPRRTTCLQAPEMASKI